MKPSTTTSGADALRQERAFFEANRAQLVAKSAGKFVLIKGRKLHGVFEAKFDAIDAGYERLGNVPFFVHKVTAAEEPLLIVTPIIAA